MKVFLKIILEKDSFVEKQEISRVSYTLNLPVTRIICGLEVRLREVYVANTQCKIYGKLATSVVLEKYGKPRGELFFLDEESEIKISNNFATNVDETLVTRSNKHIVFKFDVIFKREGITFFCKKNQGNLTEILRINNYQSC